MTTTHFRFLFCLLMAFTLPLRVLAYDVLADFSTNHNPNGVWSYGWEAGAGAAFQRMTNSSAGPSGVVGWKNGLQTPYFCVIDKNYTSNSIQNGTVLYYTDTLHMDPQSYASVVRFTAPSAGNYQVTGFFRLQDTGTHAHDLSVVLNSNLTAYYVDTSGGHTGQQYAFDFPCSLTNGETVDFMVSEDGDYAYLGTGLEATVNLSTNVPPVGTYSAAGDFNPHANPNGPWSYVFWSNSAMSGPAYLLTTNGYPVAGVSNIVSFWNGGSSSALTSVTVTGDATGSPYSDSQHPNVILYPDTLMEDPEGFAVSTRFTVPANGMYVINGFYRVQDEETQNAGHSALATVFTNGNTNSPIFSAQTGGNPFGTQFPFNFTNFFLAGTALDFAVADGNGGTYLSTGMKVVITSLNPFLNAPTYSPGAFTFTFQSVSNVMYTIQETTNLVSSNWINYSNFTANGSVMLLTVPVTSTIPAQFFRLVSP